MFSLGAHVDAVFQGTGEHLPPDILLDYMYGVAAYKCWRSSDEVHGLMRSFHDNHYANIPVPPLSPPYDDSNSLSSSEDPLLASPKERCYTSTRRGDEMVKAMDDLNIVLMALKGITPQELISRREKQMEEEEQRAQIASQSKVLEWIASGSTV